MLNKKTVRTQNIAFKKAFTLIELLVVIAIIGILATLAVVALQQARQNARDSKRMADMKQVHTALELFYNENNRYPTQDEWNSGSIVSSSTEEIFMYNIPSAPAVVDGDCPATSSNYIYTPLSDGASYTIDFCTGKQVSNLPEGAKQMTPGGIIFGSSGYTGNGGGDPFAGTSGTFIDDRDGESYAWVRIGEQIWMAENLKYLPEVHGPNTGWNSTEPRYAVYGYTSSDNSVVDAKAYMHTAGNTFNMYQTYGVLYNWHAVNQIGENAICPDGWHVPSDAEWETLTNFIGDNNGKKLKSARTEVGSPEVGISTNEHPRWTYHSTGFGTDEFNFNALPAGYRFDSASFANVGSLADFWSSSEDGSYAWRFRLSSHSASWRGTSSFVYGYSVRCIKN